MIISCYHEKYAEPLSLQIIAKLKQLQYAEYSARKVTALFRPGPEKCRIVGLVIDEFYPGCFSGLFRFLRSLIETIQGQQFYIVGLLADRGGFGVMVQLFLLRMPPSLMETNGSFALITGNPDWAKAIVPIRRTTRNKRMWFSSAGI